MTKQAPAVVLLIVALCVCAPSAAQSPEVLAKDEKGDVALTPSPGLDAAARRTIDLRLLKMTSVDAGVKTTLRVNKLRSTRNFDQVFYFYLSSQGYPYAYLMARTSSKVGVAALEGAATPSGFAQCKTSTRVKAKRKLLVTVLPWRCAPEGTVKVDVSAYTTRPGEQSGAVVFSTDRMSVPGSVNFTPPTASSLDIHVDVEVIGAGSQS